MSTCSVKDCEISAYLIKNRKLPLSMHMFPKEKCIRRKWNQFCGLANDSQKHFICSQHFMPEDFERRYQDTGRRFLVKNAIPSIRYPPSGIISERSQRARRKAQSKLVEELIETTLTEDLPSEEKTDLFPISVSSGKIDGTMSENNMRCEGSSDVMDFMQAKSFPAISTPDMTSTVISIDSVNVIERSINTNLPLESILTRHPTKPHTLKHMKTVIHEQRIIIRRQRSQLQEKDSQIRALNKRLMILDKQKEKQINELKADLKHMRTSIEEVQSCSENYVNTRVAATLQSVFTTNQIDLIMGTKKKVVWTADEIAMAFALRYHSQPAYQIVRTELHIPLPCLRSLREWASCIEMRRGLLNDVFTVLKIAGKHMNERERVVVLGYDEISVNGTVEYDKRNDNIIGPHKEMQVVSARGLFGKWKQPVFAEFDQMMTIDVLNKIITRFHEIGFTVVANVHDCGGGNLSLWKQLGIDHVEGNTVMQHPITKQDIYFFPDAPHLLKLIRNWLLDHGFLYKGKMVTKRFLIQLVEKGSTLETPFSKKEAKAKNSEFNSLFKLSIKHVTTTGAERQNVRLAAELLSHTTAVNLRRHFGEYEEAQLLAEIIDKINSWFDVLNSYRINESIVSKKCYGMEIEVQNVILDEMKDLMENIRTLNKHCLPASSHLQIFQKSVLVSIISLKKLYLKMKTDYNISFLMTYKLNQDFIENLFAMLRLNGGSHDHPSPLNALERLRLIILGKNLKQQLKVNQNTENLLIEENYIMTELFRKKKNFIENRSDANISCMNASEDDDIDDKWEYEKKERSLEEEDGIDYAVGYMARRFLTKNPDYGMYTHQLSEHSRENYVEDLSRGGLVQPSNTWSEISDQMNQYFDYIHNSGNRPDFRNPNQVKQRTIKKIRQKFPSIPDEVVKKYVTTRINIRIRHMKKRIQEQKLHHYKILKNKAIKNRFLGEDRKERCTLVNRNQRKIKHFVN